MEIRGVGLIDIPALFGIRAVRQQKRVEVVVQLEDWHNAQDGDRSGLIQGEADVLGVTLPKVIVLLNPGNNITVISEVVAMNHLLRLTGIDTAAAFNERLIRRMREQKGLREYLQEDFE
jgi:HPr kinase/phosphorylase